MINILKLFKRIPRPVAGFFVCGMMGRFLDMNKTNIMYDLAYGISIGAGVAITLGVALDNIAIGILIGLGSGGMQ